MAESALFQVGDVVVFTWEQIDNPGWLGAFFQIKEIDLGRSLHDKVLYQAEILKSGTQHRAGKVTCLREDQIKAVPPLMALAAIGEVDG